MNLTIATGSHWFRFQGKEFKIKKAGILDNVAFAETEPHDQLLTNKLCEEIQANKRLSVYLGNNYVCFPEDYPQTLK